MQSQDKQDLKNLQHMERVAILLIPESTAGEKLMGWWSWSISKSARQSYLDMKACSRALGGAMPLASALRDIRRALFRQCAMVAAVSCIVTLLAISSAFYWVQNRNINNHVKVIGGGHKGDNNVIGSPETGGQPETLNGPKSGGGLPKNPATQ